MGVMHWLLKDLPGRDTYLYSYLIGQCKLPAHIYITLRGREIQSYHIPGRRTVIFRTVLMTSPILATKYLIPSISDMQNILIHSSRKRPHNSMELWHQVYNLRPLG